MQQSLEMSVAVISVHLKVFPTARAEWRSLRINKIEAQTV